VGHLHRAGRRVPGDDPRSTLLASWLAIPFGIGGALVLDEFALLLNLQDVYWAKEGRQSLDAVVLVLAVLGVYLVAERFWRAALREVLEHVRKGQPRKR
jgi:hypothetical protein